LIFFSLYDKLYVVTNGDKKSKGSNKIAYRIFPELGYLAPEVYEKRNYSKQTDIFSFGIICWELFSHPNKVTKGYLSLYPSEISDLSDLDCFAYFKEKYLEGNTIFDFDNIESEEVEMIPDNVKNLISNCTNQNVNKRYSDVEEITNSKLLDYVEPSNHLEEFWKNNFGNEGKVAFDRFYREFRNHYMIKDDLIGHELKNLFVNSKRGPELRKSHNFTKDFIKTKRISQEMNDLMSRKNIGESEDCIDLDLWKNFELLFGRMKPNEFIYIIVDLLKKPWWKGFISVDESLRVLKNNKMNFIVRGSTSSPTDFTISYQVKKRKLMSKKLFFHERINYQSFCNLYNNFQETIERKRKARWKEEEKKKKEK